MALTEKEYDEGISKLYRVHVYLYEKYGPFPKGRPRVGDKNYAERKAIETIITVRNVLIWEREHLYGGA